MKIPKDRLDFKELGEWRQWLADHHAEHHEAWLVIYKAASPRKGITLSDAVEEALCYGWIDSLMQPMDSLSYALRFTPRKAKSIWSRVNRERAERLIAAGRMAEAGLEKIRESMANGEWDKALSREDISKLPADLDQAFAENPEVKARFDALSFSKRKIFIQWIVSAKTQPTRQRRIQELIEMVEQGRWLGDQKGSDEK